MRINTGFSVCLHKLVREIRVIRALKSYAMFYLAKLTARVSRITVIFT